MPEYSSENLKGWYSTSVWWSSIQRVSEDIKLTVKSETVSLKANSIDKIKIFFDFNSL
jgi:hypothetical protein